jgi:hypothetical protein
MPGSVTIKSPLNQREEAYHIPDSREGWVNSVRLLLESFANGKPLLSFDYSAIRPAGLPIHVGYGSRFLPLATSAAILLFLLVLLHLLLFLLVCHLHLSLPVHDIAHASVPSPHRTGVAASD